MADQPDPNDPNAPGSDTAKLKALGLDSGNSLFNSELRPLPGETYDSWLTRFEKVAAAHPDHKQDFDNARIIFKKKEADIRAAFGKDGVKADPNAAANAAADTEAKRRADRLSNFADEMSKLDPNDPMAKRVQEMAQRGAAMQSMAAGAGEGGMSGLNSQQATVGALTGYGMQRKGLALNALESLQGAQLNRDQFNNQLDQQREAVNQQAYANQMGQKQQMGSMVGGVLGTAAGAYFGVPGLGQAGSAIGGGVATFGTKPYQSSYKPTYNSSTYNSSGGGGLGGGNY